MLRLLAGWPLHPHHPPPSLPPPRPPPTVKMVCDTCEKKLSKLVVPDKWKDGARNVVGGKDGGVRVQSAGPSSINKVHKTKRAG